MISAASDVQTEADAYRLLEALRWPDGDPACPHCGSSRRTYFLTPTNGHSRKTRDGSLSQRRVWKCAGCRKQFSVLTGTILHGSKLPVRTWMLVVGDVVRSGENGLSARDLEHNHRLRPGTASFVIDRLRDALKREPLASLVSSRVVADDSTFGRTSTIGPNVAGEPYARTPMTADRLARVRVEIRSTIAHVRRDSNATRP